MRNGWVFPVSRRACFFSCSALLAPGRKRHSQADHQLMAAIWSLRGRQHHGETLSDD